MLFNLHTHTRFSDGSAEPEAYIEEALRQGFTTLGFSDHSPVPFENSFAIREEELQAYGETIRELQALYSAGGPGASDPAGKSKIQILLALEIDFIPGITRTFNEYRQLLALDYTIGSVHLVRNSDPGHLWFIDGPDIAIYDRGLTGVFNGDIRKGVTAYYRQIQEMVAIQKPDIVGHLDKIKMYNRDRYFSEEAPWYVELVDETLGLIKETGCVVEVNTRGIYKKRSETLFPGPAILKKLFQQNIPITLSSDAHKPHEISLLFTETKELLYDLGFRELTNFTRAGRETVPLTV
ncbi:MAG: histidinol-phosphatase [Bacteroidota bacterium]